MKKNQCSFNLIYHTQNKNYTSLRYIESHFNQSKMERALKKNPTRPTRLFSWSFCDA